MAKKTAPFNRALFAMCGSNVSSVRETSFTGARAARAGLHIERDHELMTRLLCR